MHSRRSFAQVRPLSSVDEEKGLVDEVVDYLRDRGLTADDEDAGHLLRRLLELPLRNGSKRLSVMRAAQILYTSRRTLGRHCKKAGLPNPSHILALGRILHTIRVVQDTGLPFNRVAGPTGWSDQFALSNSMHRLTGLRPTEARHRGPLFIAEAWLRHQLEEGAVELRSPQPASCPSCGQEIEVAEEESGAGERAG